MALHPTDPAPERILAYGPAGSGKTTNLLNIAKFANLTKSPSRFFIGDSDFAMDRMIAGYPELTFSIFGDPNFNNPDARVVIFPLFEWKDYERFLIEVRRAATPLDWVGIDFIGSAWTAVQEYYVNQVFHQDIGDYFLKVRKEISNDASKLGALEGWVDWAVINPIYKKWVNHLLFRGRYHLYATAKSDNLSSDRKPTEDSQTRQLFARYQVKPVGQKDLPFQFHTLLLTGRGSNGDRTMTAIKDRERQEVSGTTITSFTTDYLVNIAGWKLA